MTTTKGTITKLFLGFAILTMFISTGFISDNGDAEELGKVIFYVA